MHEVVPTALLAFEDTSSKASLELTQRNLPEQERESSERNSGTEAVIGMVQSKP